MNLTGLKYLIVGAGFWGATLAERIASVLNEPVLVIDRRSHFGGNSYSERDPETGIECHMYGTHIFHTKVPRVWEYTNRFSAFTGYRHKVLTEYQGHVHPMPISLATINSFYRRNLRPYEVAVFIAGEAGKERYERPANLEEKAVSLVGRPLYEAFIKGYTQKQWEKDPRELPPEIITRLPVRSNYNTDYFDDRWQGMPVDGYAALFSRLLDHPRIDLRLNVDYKDIAGHIPPTCRVFYTGPLDEFFDFSLGHLEWRSLRFEKSIEPYQDFQGTSVLNQADAEVPYTRAHEFKHLHPERGPQGDTTVVVREYSLSFRPGGEPYYPVNTPANETLLEAYRARLRAQHPNIIPGGRLGAYTYMDMDKTIESALDAFDALAQELTTS